MTFRVPTDARIAVMQHVACDDGLLRIPVSDLPHEYVAPSS